MPESIRNINRGPKPGTAFKIILEEYVFLDEFMKMMKKKVELEQNHLRELKNLRVTWNSKWKDSGVWPLISPLLSYIRNEIDYHEKANKEIEEHLAEISIGSSPAAHKDGDVNPLTILESLEELHNNHQHRHARIKSPESRAKLRTWKEEALIKEQVLPEDEREYRRAVVKQQRAVDQAQDWLSTELPEVLKQHQDRAEDVKKFSIKALNAYSLMHSESSKPCSTATQSTRAFAPSWFISPRHDEAEQEKSHPFLRKAHYRNYILDGQVARPLFGLGAHETVEIVQQILEVEPNTENHRQHRYHAKWMFTAFELETKAVNTAIPTLLKGRFRQNLAGLAGYAFSSDTPLATLSKEDVSRYRNGVPRAKLTALVDQMMPVARREVLSLKFQLLDLRKGLCWDDYSSFAARALVHNHEAGNIIENIWRKWDFEKHRPFPEGVQRVWNQKECKPEVVLRRNGRVI